MLGVTENGFQEMVENAELQSAENNTQSGDAQEPPAEEAPGIEDGNQPSDDQPKEEIQPSSVEDTLVESSQQQQSGGAEHQEPSAEVAQLADVYSEEQQPEAETQTVSRKMEVPNNKVNNMLHDDQLGSFGVV